MEVAGGLISGSLALLADAGHMLTDVLALGVAITASHLACLPATPERTFGLVRAEVVGAFINGASLVVIVVLILIESWQRMSDPVEIDGPLMLAGRFGIEHATLQLEPPEFHRQERSPHH